METINVSPTQHKVFSCEQRKEKWLEDHELAKQLYNLEDLLGDVVECYDELHRFDKVVFEQVQSGSVPYDEALDDSIVDLSKRIHHLLEFLVGTMIPDFEKHFEIVDNKSDVVDRCNRAKESKKCGYRRYARESNRNAAKLIAESLGL